MSGTHEVASLQRTLYECVIRYPGRWSLGAIESARVESEQGERTAGEWFLFLQEADGEAVPTALRHGPRKAMPVARHARLRLVR